MLTWNWKNKIGTWTEVQKEREFKFNIYKCNGLAVIIYEFKEDGKEKYNVHSFFTDLTHLKNCLGLNKGYDNIFATNLRKIEIYEDSIFRCKNDR